MKIKAFKCYNENAWLENLRKKRRCSKNIEDEKKEIYTKIYLIFFKYKIFLKNF